MEFYRSSRFERHFKKLPASIRAQAATRLVLFARDPFNPLLNNHPLHGVHKDKRSINVTGDYRIVYREVEEGVALLIDIGTHNELYGK